MTVANFTKKIKTLWQEVAIFLPRPLFAVQNQLIWRQNAVKMYSRQNWLLWISRKNKNALTGGTNFFASPPFCQTRPPPPPPWPPQSPPSIKNKVPPFDRTFSGFARGSPLPLQWNTPLFDNTNHKIYHSLYIVQTKSHLLYTFRISPPPFRLWSVRGSPPSPLPPIYWKLCIIARILSPRGGGFVSKFARIIAVLKREA